MLRHILCIVCSETNLNLHRCCISCISFLTFLDTVLNIIFTQLEIYKFQTKLTCIISNWRNISKYLFKAIFKEPLVRVLLHLNKVRHLENIFLLSVAHSDSITGFDRINSVLFHLTHSPLGIYFSSFNLAKLSAHN